MSGMLHRVLEFSVDPPTAGHHDHSPTWLPTWLPTCCAHARTMCLPAPADGVSIPSVGPTLGILIGLGAGIDYALFIVTRHRSNLKDGMPPWEAAVRALNTSGRAVLFAGEIGLGMAAAVLLDAFLLRTLLVPALMHLAGRANWWLPGWLDRILPHLSIEPATPPAAQTAAPASDRYRPGTWQRPGAWVSVAV